MGIRPIELDCRRSKILKVRIGIEIVIGIEIGIEDRVKFRHYRHYSHFESEK